MKKTNIIRAREAKNLVNYNQVPFDLEALTMDKKKKLDGSPVNSIKSEYKDYAKGTLVDGRSDDFPLYAINLVTSSPTAVRCMTAYLRALRGSGFSDERVNFINAIGNIPFWQFHKSICSDVTILRRLAIRVVLDYDITIQNFKIKGFEYLPAKWIRQRLDDNLNLLPKFIYSPFLGTNDYFTYETKAMYLDEYTNDKQKIAEILQKCKDENKEHDGFLIWYCEPNLRNGAYSFPDYMAAEDAMKSDVEINVFNYHNILNGFTIGGIMALQGDPDELVPDPDYIDYKDADTYKISKRELYNRYMSDEASGAENAGKMLVFWYRNNEEKPSMIPFPTNSDTAKQYIDTRQDNTLQIVRAWGVPNVLANIETAGKLGNTKEISDALKILNEHVDDNRKVIESVYNKIFSNLQNFEYKEYVKILPFSPVYELPDKIFDSLTVEQKIEYLEKNYGIKQSNPIQP